MEVDEVLDFFKLGVGVFRQVLQVGEKPFKCGCDDTGEELVFALEMVIDHRLGNAGLFGDLDGGGGVEALFGKQKRGRLKDVLLFVESGMGHGVPFNDEGSRFPDKSGSSRGG